jgi:tripartite-type tricarboxylate transporter receptor subunit TctC
VWTPAGVPADIGSRLQEAFTASLHDPLIQERLRADSLEAIGSTSQQMAQVIRAESQQWGQLIRAKGFKLD